MLCHPKVKKLEPEFIMAKITQIVNRRLNLSNIILNDVNSLWRESPGLARGVKNHRL